MGESLLRESHQAAGDRRRDQTRCGDAVPWADAIHGLLQPGVELIAEHDRREDLAPRALPRAADGQRNRDVVARMSARFRLSMGFADDVVVEIEHANEDAVQQYGLRHAGPRGLADHRAWPGDSGMALSAACAAGSRRPAKPQPIVSSSSNFACSIAAGETASAWTDRIARASNPIVLSCACCFATFRPFAARPR